MNENNKYYPLVMSHPRCHRNCVSVTCKVLWKLVSNHPPEMPSSDSTLLCGLYNAAQHVIKLKNRCVGACELSFLFSSWWQNRYTCRNRLAFEDRLIKFNECCRCKTNLVGINLLIPHNWLRLKPLWQCHTNLTHLNFFHMNSHACVNPE